MDLVLRQLGRLGCPHFVLSCRVADWRSATGLEAIREQYPEEPLELHLEPFDDTDAATFLSASLGAETDLVLITAMRFDDRAALDAGLASDAMRAADRNLREIAPGLATLLVLEDADDLLP